MMLKYSILFSMKNTSTPNHRRRTSVPHVSVVKKQPIALPAQCDAFELEIIEFVKGFTSDVSESIAMNEVLFKNNLPQRCLKHNNVLTLYCEKDRVPLCVSCMYHGTEHKNHKVVPLKNASKSILTDTQNFNNKVQRRIEEIDNLLRISTENILKIEKIYPEVCSRIEQGFKQLHQLLIKKEQEHIKDLYLVTQKLRSNHLVLIDEMSKLMNLFLDKTSIKPDSNDDETNIYTRSVLSTILDSRKYIHVDVKPIQFNIYPHYTTSMFTDIQNELLQKLQVKKFPTIITLNHQHLEVNPLSRIADNSQNSKDQTASKLSKSQILSKFKASNPNRPSFSPLNSTRRTRRD